MTLCTKTIKFVGIIKSLTLIYPVPPAKLNISELINPHFQETSQVFHFVAQVVGVKFSLVLVLLVQVLLEDLQVLDCCVKTVRI